MITPVLFGIVFFHFPALRGVGPEACFVLLLSEPARALFIVGVESLAVCVAWLSPRIVRVAFVSWL